MNVAQLIQEATTGARRLTAVDWQRVREEIAGAGFDPSARERVRGRLAGLHWRGAVLQGHDYLPPADTHYLWHAVQRQEWPPGTTPGRYVASIEQAVLDRRSGICTGRYQGAWQVTIVGRTEGIRGPGGGEWLLVDYRLATAHWVTAYQPRDDVQTVLFGNPNRSEVRWRQRPRP